MIKHIHVRPLAAESLGVRSMCTYVETPDVRLLLDAGVSLCPFRYGLPPHPLEFRAIDESRKRIAEAAEKAEIVTISHYHYDHHTPSFEDWLSQWTDADETARQIYESKTVLAKNPREQINPSQRERGWMFRQTAGKYAQSILNADNKSFVFQNTTLRFSEPVFHGSDDSFLGWVLMVTIEHEHERFLFAPDVQGPMSRRTLDIILAERPFLLMIGGPPLYLSPSRVSEKEVQIGLKNLEAIIGAVPHVILEHHILRDAEWQEKASSLLYAAYKSGSTLQTAAEFLGEQNSFLEARRKEFFTEAPPTREFEKWMHGNEEAKKHSKPPI